MSIWKSTFWMILLCLLSLSLCIACGDDDDDDSDDGDDDSGGDDDNGGDCTQETLCELVVNCGVGDYANVEECIAQQDQAPDSCDIDAILACSCDCMDQYPNDCTQLMECGGECWETYC